MTMTAEERQAKRIEIIQDCLKILDLPGIRPICGTYLYVSDKFHRDLAPGRDMQEYLPLIQERCDVCAIGVMLLSYIRVFDNVSSKEFLNHAESDLARIKLKEFFTRSELDEIEATFEGFKADPTNGEYCVSYPLFRERAKAIFQNMMNNNGIFIP